ncbi:MAG: metallophosphoesterase [Flexistipes sinusarabici]|uniref:Phosphoesterase n=2 Tax=Flexistipes sinusarabici TaxID=2352 RepID=A0A5D0MVC4_FLESI|nr:MAG: metallophosphoesterase [Flexistipes sinusarabici]
MGSAMKVGVISDSHDNVKNLSFAVEYFNRNGADYVIHCGDIISPFAADCLNKLQMPYTGVFGNNDGEWLGLDKITEGKIVKGPIVTEIGGCRFAVFHEPSVLDYISSDVPYVLYGHTHSKDLKKRNNQTIINPGTLGGYMADNASFAVINTVNGEIDFIDL